jgi:hypothetical protein
VNDYSSKIAVVANGAMRVLATSARSLGLPLENVAGAWLGACAVLVVYAATMSRDLSAFDSPELAMVAVQVGLGHPIGQPLHTLLGWLFSHLPGIAPLLGLNFLSALFGALAVIPAVSIGEGLLRTASVTSAEGSPRSSSAVLCAAVALCGLHAALWEPATRIEVYPTATFFALWCAARIGEAWQNDNAPGRDFFLAGFALGLSACANALIATTGAAAIVLRWAALRKRHALPLRAIAALLCGGLVGLAPFGYVFAVAHRKDVFVWGAPTDLDAVLFYFQGLDFRGRDYQPIAVARRIGEWLLWSIQNMSFPLFALGIGSHFLLAREKRLGRSFALWVFVFTLAQIITNRLWRVNNPDYLGYMSTPLWLSAAGISALVAEGWRSGRRALVAAAFAALIALVASAPPDWRTRSRHLDHVTRLLAQGALDEAPAKGILLVASDHWVFPLLYLQMVEKERPDVTVVAYGLANSSWYWELMYRRHPDLVSIPLRAPGGRSARIARFLAANRARPVYVENIYLAQKVGRTVCPGGWLLKSGDQCQVTTEPDLRPLAALHNALNTLGSGSPATDEIIAAESFARGESLLRLGFFREAFEAFIAGAPRVVHPARAQQRAFSVALPTLLKAYPIPRWRKSALLGDPGRNLYMAAVITRFTGDLRGALVYLIAASSAGLPEAKSELAAIRGRRSNKRLPP